MNPSERPIRVVIVDDDQLLCNALSFMITNGSNGKIEVVGIANSGEASVDLVIQHRPDVVLMDLSMPGIGGLEATRRITALPNPPFVIIVTALESANEPVDAVHAGASGFLLKSENPTEILEAIDAVARGEGALSTRTARQIMDHIGTTESSVEKVRARRLTASLTDRELAVARLVSQGLTNTSISSRLGLSTSTIKTHVSSIQAKFGVDSRVLIAVEMTRAEA